MRKAIFLRSTAVIAGCVIAASAAAQSSAPVEAAAAAPAQAAPGSAAWGEEIIVTANKRNEPLQKVAQTVNVVSGATIQDLHIQNTIELTQVVGGLSLTMTSPSEQSISLRGIKEPSGGGPSSLTVESYLNEVPITVFDTFASTLDLGQVEVLKGPQGTLRGRPSPSGAITIATQKGSFTDYSGYANATWSDHQGRRLEAAFGGPVSSTLAFRLAGVHDYNSLTEVRDINNGKRNFQDTTVLRGTLDWAPSDKFSADLMGQYTRQKGDFYRQVTGRAPCAGDQGGAILVGSVACGQTFDLKDKVALNQAPSPNDYHGKLVTLNARYNLSDRIGIVYVGGYNDTTYFTTTNLDFAGIGSANQVPLDFHATTKRRAISNELRLQSEGPGFYNFTYGLYQQNTRSDAIANLPPIFTGQPTRTTTNDYGVFTNQRFQFGPRDSVQLGVRYSKVDIKNRLDGSSRSYDAVTGNASYQHQFTQNVMAYASYGTAYRPGSAGANGSPVAGVIPASFGNFGDEKSHSVEIGMKTQWFNKRLTLNVALFDQKYKGYITSQFNVACTGVPNPNGLAFATNNGLQNGPQCFGTMTGNGNAVSRGIEVEARANVTRAWTISGIFTYTDAHFANASLPCNDYNGDGVLDVSGVPMVQKGQYVSLCKENGPLGSLPKVSFTANTSYDFNVGNIPAYIRLNSFTRGSSFFPQTGGTFAGYTIVNGSVGVLTSDRKWELSLWGKNLFNTVKEDSDGGPWTIYGVPSGLRVGTVTNNREVGVTLRRIF